jgi:hypothetical protein
MRKFTRHKFNNASVDISDGIGFYPGIIQDISRFGMHVIDVSNKLDTSQNKYTVVVNIGRNNFKLSARPKWVKEEGSSIQIGLQIDPTSLEWTKFLIELEYNPDEVTFSR